jgi:hypothetical protein
MRTYRFRAGPPGGTSARRGSAPCQGDTATALAFPQETSPASALHAAVRDAASAALE